MASSSKRAEMALEKIFDDEDSADVMDSGGESDLDRQVENESGDRGEKSIMAITKWSPSNMLSWKAKFYASGCLFVVDFSRISWNLITNLFLRLWKSIIYAKSVFLAMRCNAIQSICTTGGPSSSCEMIILRNNSHGGIIRVCMGIFTTALRNKKIRQILNKNTSPYFHSVSLVIWSLNLMNRAHLSELNNSLKWALFIKVSDQITSNTLWK